MSHDLNSRSQADSTGYMADCSAFELPDSSVAIVSPIRNRQQLGTPVERVTGRRVVVVSSESDEKVSDRNSQPNTGSGSNYCQVVVVSSEESANNPSPGDISPAD